MLAHSTGGNIRLTVAETSALGEDLYLVKHGSADFAEDNTTLPGNNADHLRPIPNGTIYAELGSVELRVADDVVTHQNSQIVAGTSIDIRGGDYGNLDTGGGGVTEWGGTTMILRGKIAAGAS